MPTLTIVSASDSRYLPGLFVTWGSILKFSPSISIDFHLLHDGVNDQEVDQLRSRLSKVRGNFTVTAHQLEDKLFADFPEFFYDSKMPYARLLIPKIIDSDRVLYVDTDFVLTRDVSEFLEVDFQDKAIAVAEEWDYNGTDDSMRFADQFPNVADHRYFNSGLLYLNLDRIRAQGSFDQAMKLLVKYTDRCLYYDQTALNVVFAGRCVYLDPNVNYQIKSGHEPDVASLSQLSERGVNLHYVAKTKPWLCTHHSLAHRFYHTVRASLEGDQATAKRCRQSMPVLASCLINGAKGVRLKTTAAIGIGDASGARRIGREHFKHAHLLWRELCDNNKIAAMLRSI
ncbi:glycosyltransferase family 8 protein [Roseiconus lacunae]|uniref:glycosyltransferase family 8 protein n=1 Tax=Roseiconus lacunae TaxID=2605694 RepID=UPI0011F2A35D|nr:glycosyltransferase family 8 protein [Roseiconus lacunae]